MLKKYKDLIIFIIIGLIVFFILFYSKINSDLIWNFGFSYNTAMGKLMYQDFNMVISPLYPLITGLFMAIFGKNMLVFTIINTIYVMLVIYLVYKINPKIYLLSVPFAINACLANYDTFCILFAIMLIYFEKKRKNDYLIGFIIGLAFLTKINSGVLLAIPSLYYFKDFKKILKRFTGFMIPNVITILVFAILDNLKNYISYVFLGILDFAKNNFQFSIVALIVPLVIIYLIYLFVKEKNIMYLYGIFFTAMIYPVMNEIHVMIATFPAIITILNKFDEFVYRLRYFTILFILIPIAGFIIDSKNNDFTYDDNIFKYRPIQSIYLKNRDDLKSYFQGYYGDVCFLLYDNYLYKLLLDLPINKYDVILYGNLGYNGTKKMINYLKTLEDDHYFVLDSTITGAQYNMEIMNYVQTHMQIDAMVGNFYIFKKKPLEN